MFTKINGLFTQRSKPQTTTGKIKAPSPASPELTLVILDKAFSPLARDPVFGQFETRAKKSDQSIPVIESGTEATPRVKCLYSTRHRNQAATYKKNKIHFRHNFFIFFFCFVFKSVKETGS